ncbi:MAG: hypothetical protein KDD53_00280 [Bdellovibrionales bacterium]|nr:hypothetical protein [Bdellovibrionales bacterium]
MAKFEAVVPSWATNSLDQIGAKLPGFTAEWPRLYAESPEFAERTLEVAISDCDARTPVGLAGFEADQFSRARVLADFDELHTQATRFYRDTFGDAVDSSDKESLSTQPHRLLQASLSTGTHVRLLCDVGRDTTSLQLLKMVVRAIPWNDRSDTAIVIDGRCRGEVANEVLCSPSYIVSELASRNQLNPHFLRLQVRDPQVYEELAAIWSNRGWNRDTLLSSCALYYLANEPVRYSIRELVPAITYCLSQWIDPLSIDEVYASAHAAFTLGDKFHLLHSVCDATPGVDDLERPVLNWEWVERFLENARAAHPDLSREQALGYLIAVYAETYENAQPDLSHAVSMLHEGWGGRVPLLDIHSACHRRMQDSSNAELAYRRFDEVIPLLMRREIRSLLEGLQSKKDVVIVAKPGLAGLIAEELLT